MELDLPIPSGAAIILSAGIIFLGCAGVRAVLPALKGDIA
jgi:zinc transport system permease protein